MKPRRQLAKHCTKVAPPSPQVQDPIYTVIEFPVLDKVEGEVLRPIYDDLLFVELDGR